MSGDTAHENFNSKWNWKINGGDAALTGLAAVGGLNTTVAAYVAYSSWWEPASFAVDLFVGASYAAIAYGYEVYKDSYPS